MPGLRTGEGGMTACALVRDPIEPHDLTESVIKRGSGALLVETTCVSCGHRWWRPVGEPRLRHPDENKIPMVSLLSIG